LLLFDAGKIEDMKEDYLDSLVYILEGMIE
jgi:hypothetical protein